MINHLVQQRYEVVERVGESPLFTAYKARDRVSTQVVALKTLQASYTEDRPFVMQLQRCARATEELNHPNIARFRDCGDEAGTTFIVYEFVRGINLKERIRRIAPFTLSVAVDFACGIAEALHYAHKLGQPHGDLRPQNVIISPEGALKVTDFGVQRAVCSSVAARQACELRSAPYHAPELSPQDPGTVAGDIYALGVTIYEMLTGAPLYAGDSAQAIADQHASSPIPSPRVISPGVPRSVEGIVLKCLQKRPEQRYGSAAELLRDLKAVRDALRFGKSLSWSPMENENVAAEAPPAAAETTTSPRNGSRTYPVPSRVAREPAEPAAPEPVPVTSKQNRMRAEAEKVSFAIRALTVMMMCVIVFVVFGFMYVWATRWVVPRAETLPKLEGKSIDEVRSIVGKMKLRPLEHAVYMDLPRGTVYQTDPRDGAETRPNHVINIWYSQGPEYVDVPGVQGLDKDDAVQKLKDAGLSVGSIMPQFSSSVPQGAVIAQNVSSKKRVFHGTPVDLVISDGPKPDFASPSDSTDRAAQAPPDSGTQDTTPPGGSSHDSAAPAPSPDDAVEHHFDRIIRIPADHLGKREVQVSYRDATGSDTTVINEDHIEGDRVPVSFTYYGKNITLTIQYNGRQVWRKTFDPEATSHETVK